jgi:hypothetical protein
MVTMIIMMLNMFYDADTDQYFDDGDDDDNGGDDDDGH